MLETETVCTFGLRGRSSTERKGDVMKLEHAYVPVPASKISNQ